MKMKRIEAPSLGEALRQVETELGKDALVIDTQSTRTGYAVLAAPQEMELSPSTEDGRPKKFLKKLLTPRPWTPGFTALAETAAEFGLSSRILRAVENALIGTRLNLDKPGDPALPTMAARVLKALVPCHTATDRVVAFVGPTGVGKTTTLAKIAAKAVREDGDSIAIVSFDTYRVAAVEQLRAFSEILNVPFSVAFTPLDLRRFIQEHADKDRIFVDTTGRGAFDGDSINTIAGALTAAKVPSYLCMPAGLRGGDAKSVVLGFDAMKPTSLVITKWDETIAPGETLSLAIERGFPISHVTVGQEVPEDIVTADPGVIAANAFNLSEQAAEKIL